MPSHKRFHRNLPSQDDAGLEPHGQGMGSRSLVSQPLRFKRTGYVSSIWWGQHILLVFLLASKVSEAQLRLTQEEAAEVERGKETPHKVSASVFICMGLELEDQQYVYVLQSHLLCLITK